MEQSLVLIKPDAVMGGKIGSVITRLEEKGLQIQAMKMIWIDDELAKNHYQEHKGKDFFDGLISYITKSPVVAMVIAGEEAIGIIRNLAGDTDPAKAQPGSIRGDFGLCLDTGNVIHASDSKGSAAREIDLFFTGEEIYDY